MPTPSSLLEPALLGRSFESITSELATHLRQPVLIGVGVLEEFERDRTRVHYFLSARLESEGKLIDVDLMQDDGPNHGALRAACGVDLRTFTHALDRALESLRRSRAGARALPDFAIEFHGDRSVRHTLPPALFVSDARCPPNPSRDVQEDELGMSLV